MDGEMQTNLNNQEKYPINYFYNQPPSISFNPQPSTSFQSTSFNQPPAPYPHIYNDLQNRAMVYQRYRSAYFYSDQRGNISPPRDSNNVATYPLDCGIASDNYNVGHSPQYPTMPSSSKPSVPCNSFCLIYSELKG